MFCNPTAFFFFYNTGIPVLSPSDRKKMFRHGPEEKALRSSRVTAAQLQEVGRGSDTRAGRVAAGFPSNETGSESRETYGLAAGHVHCATSLGLEEFFRCCWKLSHFDECERAEVPACP